MKNLLYFVRHGCVTGEKLNSDGISFADKLPEIINCSHINFIASVNGKKRCSDTINKLKKAYKPLYKEYLKEEFLNLKPYYDSLNHEVSVICYGIEDIVNIFKKLEIILNEGNRDEFYKKIIIVSVDKNNRFTYKFLDTGFVCK